MGGRPLRVGAGRGTLGVPAPSVTLEKGPRSFDLENGVLGVRLALLAHAGVSAGAWCFEVPMTLDPCVPARPVAPSAGPVSSRSAWVLAVALCPCCHWHPVPHGAWRPPAMFTRKHSIPGAPAPGGCAAPWTPPRRARVLLPWAPRTVPGRRGLLPCGPCSVSHTGENLICSFCAGGALEPDLASAYQASSADWPGPPGPTGPPSWSASGWPGPGLGWRSAEPTAL